ncbi:MAG TPA: response regulator [Gaiellaceae bacterium]|nr:response regulator [Gaiellaceae bacterium]
MPPASPDNESSKAPGLLVLIVDDDPRNVKLAGDVLAAAGFRTLEAATGEAAVALAGEHLPDVVLMDLRLPDMDGTDAARMLAQQARTASIPVVALTSVTLEDDPAWLRTACFAGYLAKPIDIEAFPAQVRRYCR